MGLQSSGPISLLDIANEFGGSTPHSLSEYYGVDVGIPSSGAISMSQFYDASNTPWAPTQSTTLTSSQSWTVPSGITYIRFTLTGGTFVPVWANVDTIGLRFQYTGTAPSTASATAAFNGWESTHGLSGTLGASSGTRTISRPLFYSHTLDTGETVTVHEYAHRGWGTAFSSNNFWNTGSFTVRGAYSSYAQYNPSGTMGQYGHYAAGKSWTSGVYTVPAMEYLIPAPTSTNAPDATMFGYTASGKSSGTANTTGPINLTVTPNQSYSFSGGNLYLFYGEGLYPYGITSSDASVFLEW